MASFYEKLQSATNEDKAVNPIYKDVLKRNLIKVSTQEEYPADIDIENVSYEYHTDGLFRCYYTRKDGTIVDYALLMECKTDINFNNITEKCKVLVQVLCYLRQMQNDGKVLPRIVLIGSKVTCSVMPVHIFDKYLGMYINNVTSASTAWQNNPNILELMCKDERIAYEARVLNTWDTECVRDMCRDILRFARIFEDGEDSYREDFSARNLSRAFDYFDIYVLADSEKKKLSPREKKDKFMMVVLDKDRVYQLSQIGGFAVGTKTVKLEIAGEKIEVNFAAYQAFINTYNIRYYSKMEQKELTAITDRLIEDADRRMKGDFYTPTIWVDEAYNLLDRNLGDDWKEEYIVWDCAWGTGNLTRDYNFTDLYCSTIEAGDIEIGSKYNKNACKFQYDFLNDDVEEFKKATHMLEIGQAQTAVNLLKSTKLYKEAPGILDGLLRGKKLLFLINPPYGTAKNGGADTVSKAGIAMTKMNEIMLEDGIGASAQQLYAQFIYRVLCIKKMFNNEISIGLFSPPAYITGSSFKGLRRATDGILAPVDGFILQASQFADVKDSWGISFTLLNQQGNYNGLNVNIMTDSVGKAEDIGKKKIYNLDDKNTLSDWIKIKDKGVDAPQMSSAIAWKQSGRGKLVPGALGYMMFNANNIEQSKQFVTITSSCLAGANGVSITTENFEKAMVGFTARRSIVAECCWINWQDEFMAPDTTHPLYSQWQVDAIIYALFNSKSNQSSLRGVDYGNKTWNIENHFFFMSRKEIEKIAGGFYSKEDINNDIEDDLETFGNKERFVYEKIKNLKLSPDAQAVLDKACELVRKSFKYRNEFNRACPEYQINTWDAGWYQIKGLLKKYDKQGLEEFNELYKALEDRMRSQIYELGFLYK